MSRMCNSIPPPVRLTFRLRYGDYYQHKHFAEPEDTSLRVKLINEIV